MCQLLFAIVFLVAATLILIIDSFVMIKRNAKKTVGLNLLLASTTIASLIMLSLFFSSVSADKPFFYNHFLWFSMLILIIPPYAIHLHYGESWEKLLLVLFGMFFFLLTKGALILLGVCMILVVISHYLRIKEECAKKRRT